MQYTFEHDRGGSIVKNKIVIWLGLVLVLPVLMAACSGTTPAAETSTAETEELMPAESVVAEEPTSEPKTIGPRSGDIAPDFSLPDSNGNMVRLSDQLLDNRLVILVFYHAYN